MNPFNIGRTSPVGQPSSIGGLDPSAVLRSFNSARSNAPKLAVQPSSLASSQGTLVQQLLRDVSI